MECPRPAHTPTKNHLFTKVRQNKYNSLFSWTRPFTRAFLLDLQPKRGHATTNGTITTKFVFFLFWSSVSNRGLFASFTTWQQLRNCCAQQCWWETSWFAGIYKAALICINWQQKRMVWNRKKTLGTGSRCCWRHLADAESLIKNANKRRAVPFNAWTEGGVCEIREQRILDLHSGIIATLTHFPSPKATWRTEFMKHEGAVHNYCKLLKLQTGKGTYAKWNKSKAETARDW